TKGFCPYFDCSCSQILIHCSGTGLHISFHSDHKFTSQLFGFFKSFLSAVCFLKNQLKDTRTVPEIYENDSSLISLFLNPAHYRNGLSDIGCSKFCTSMGPFQTRH